MPTSPSLSRHDIVKVLLMNSVSSRQCLCVVVVGILFINTSYFLNLSVSQFRIVMIVPMSVAASILGNAVLNILSWRSEKQVGRSNAFWVVAMMAHMKRSFDWTKLIFKSNPMTHLGPSGPFYLSVSTIIQSPSPFPAISEFWSMFWNGAFFINPQPKPLPEGALQSGLPTESSLPAYFRTSHATTLYKHRSMVNIVT
jgi:hypothetical protein